MRLTDEWFNCFLMLKELMCYLDHQSNIINRFTFLLVQELMTHVESFQCEAQKVIQSGTTDVAQLQQLLDNGHTLDVDLPEIPKLKQV